MGRLHVILTDGKICLTNNAAERALRGFALGRKSWLFSGSDRGADRAAFMATLITTAKLNDIDPQAWLADVLTRIADTPIIRLEQLLPWNWSTTGSVQNTNVSIIRMPLDPFPTLARQTI